MSDLVKFNPSAEEQKLIRNSFAREATDAEFSVLMKVAILRNLNPLLKQIYFVKMKGVWTFQVSIDGLRALAQRTGQYGGQDEPVFAYDDKGQLLSCKVAVYRKDWLKPAVGVAFFKEFSSGQNLWVSKPHVMISKVAEAIALRKAFPEDLSGLYGEEEMEQSAAPARATVIVDDTPTAEPHLKSEPGDWDEESLSAEHIELLISGAQNTEDLLKVAQEANKLPKGQKRDALKAQWNKRWLEVAKK